MLKKYEEHKKTIAQGNLYVIHRGINTQMIQIHLFFNLEISKFLPLYS